MEKLSRSLEDYLEAIYMVSQEKKVVRVKDIVERLKVRTASVIGALRKLEEAGYIIHEHYGYIDCTPSGTKMAEFVYEKHKVLTGFFTDFLQVNPEIAQKDACIMEHYISDETLGKILHLMKLNEPGSGEIPSWFFEFKNYMRTEEQQKKM